MHNRREKSEEKRNSFSVMSALAYNIIKFYELKNV